MKKHLRIAGMATALVLIISLVASATVWAGGPGGWRGPRLGGPALEAVAEALDMTVDELRDALRGGEILADLADQAGIDLGDLWGTARSAQEAARRDAIEEAVAEGNLSRDEADWLLEGMANDYAPRLGFRGLASMGPGAASDAIAETLGLTPEELRTQLWGGRTLADLADQAGTTLEELQAAAQAARDEAFRERVAEALAQGAIDEDQSEWLLEGLENGYLDKGLALGGFGGPCGRGGWPMMPGRDGFRGRMERPGGMFHPHGNSRFPSRLEIATPDSI